MTTTIHATDPGIALGDKVRDLVTGFEGIVTSKIDYLTGCARAAVTPPAKPDGTLGDASYFDVTSLEVVEAGFVRMASAGAVAAAAG